MASSQAFSFEEHSRQLGEVVSNFHALECVLRLFLCAANGEKATGIDPEDFPLPVTYLTNRDPLGTLLKEYNKNLCLEEHEFCVDETVIQTRDAIAHGRVIGNTPSPPFRLFKPERPNKTTKLIDKLEIDELLDKEWFRTMIKKTSQQIKKVVECGQKRNYDIFPKD